MSFCIKTKIIQKGYIVCKRFLEKGTENAWEAIRSLSISTTHLEIYQGADDPLFMRLLSQFGDIFNPCIDLIEQTL